MLSGKTNLRKCGYKASYLNMFRYSVFRSHENEKYNQNIFLS